VSEVPSEPRPHLPGWKRAADLMIGAPLLLLAIPVMLLIALAIRINLGSPVFFTQQRPGLGGRPFRLIKFRSMRDVRDAGGTLLPDGDRLTRFGRWLRSTSLDELPELWNILRGDMSLVGPRPLLMEYLPLYSPEQARRHDVRPGLTGWAQISGRNTVDWDERFRLDLWYVDHMSPWLDLRILLRSVAVVFRGRGVNRRGAATMTKFTGS
jgi:lipopolysaccharide/colanic/teichoic acid biosynthesis glycosyltransferase